MSETYDVEMTYRHEDEPKFKELLHPIWTLGVIDQTESLKQVLFEAAPGNLYEDRERLAAAGLYFYGQYACHGGSTPGVFAACKGRHVDALGFNGQPAVFVDANGSFDKVCLREAKLYFKIRRQVLREFAR